MATNTQEPDVEEAIAKIFKVNPDNPQRLTSRESKTVEFKLAFHKGGKSWEEYGKTIAAFANTKGGCLVFGVKDKPHDLEGLKNSNFEDFDPAKLSEFLNKMFSPEIVWSKHSYQIEDKYFGIIHIKEGTTKPIIAISNGSDYIKEAEIYYRYRGRSEKIKYPELRRIFEDARRLEQLLWMKHLKMIASIGIENAAIFNPYDGIVTGKSGAFVIDKDLLPSLKFIREGEFKEVTGAPAIKLVGEAQILAAGEVVGTEYIERKAIRLNEIIEFFLLQRKPAQPIFFIEQACYENSGFLPLYYFASIADIRLTVLREIVESQESRNPGKRKIVERLNRKDADLYLDIPDTGTEPALRKKEIKENFVLQNLDDSDIQEYADIRYRLEALRSFKKSEINLDYIFPKLHKYYKDFWDENSLFREAFRKAICHLDKELFCPSDFYD